MGRAKANASPFESAESANEFIKAGLAGYREDYEEQKKELKTRIAELDVAIRKWRGKKAGKTALVEERTSSRSALKTLQSTYARWLMDLTKSKVLERLLPGERESLTVVFELPDLGSVTVLEVEGPPPDED